MVVFRAADCNAFAIRLGETPSLSALPRDFGEIESSFMAGGGTAGLTGLLTWQLGGRRTAQVLAMMTALSRRKLPHKQEIICVASPKQNCTSAEIH
jgi:hypothetical protein